MAAGYWIDCSGLVLVGVLRAKRARLRQTIILLYTP